MSDRTFHVLGMRHMIASVYIPSSMNKYNCTATLCRCTTTTPYRSARNVSKTLCCSSILFQIPICRLYAGTAYEAVFHPASYTYTVDCSLSGVLAKLKVCRLCMKISRLERNLRILRMRNTISRLCKFSACAENTPFRGPES